MNMIERVAKALSIADGNHPDACSNDEDEIPYWTLYVKMARAAIEAMREPTEEMANAGAKVAFMSADLWAAMIDAALSTTEGGKT